MNDEHMIPPLRAEDAPRTDDEFEERWCGAGSSPAMLNAMLYQWWQDEAVRPRLYDWILRQRKGELLFPSRAREVPDQQGHASMLPGYRAAKLVVGGRVPEMLQDAKHFRNLPYRALSDGPLLLAADAPHQAVQGVGEQRDVVEALLASLALDPTHVEVLARAATESACVLPLKSGCFDLAALAQDVALRYLALMFGIPPYALPFVQAPLDAAYRSLNFVLVGRHFEPYSQAKGREAREAVDKLRAKLAQWIDHYARYRPHDAPSTAQLILPDDEPQEAKDVANAVLLVRRIDNQMGPGPLEDFVPLLARMADSLRGGQGALWSVEELGSLTMGLLGGAFGQIQSAICRGLRASLKTGEQVQDDPVPTSLQEALDFFRQGDPVAARTELQRGRLALLARLNSDPPAPILARRQLLGQAGAETPCLEWKPKYVKGGALPDHGVIDCLLATQPFEAFPLTDSVPSEAWRVFGAGVHVCPGRGVLGGSFPDIALPPIHHAVARLRGVVGLAEDRNTATNRVVGLKSRWGGVCESYPMRHDRRATIKQSCLNVVFDVKLPVSVHAEAIRTILTYGASRVEDSLNRTGIVHFAWFDLIEGDQKLLLQTAFDGDMNTYLRVFAKLEFPVFDALFEHLDDAPPRPARQFQAEFVETVMRHHRPPAAGYFYSAYPSASLSEIRHALPTRTPGPAADGSGTPTTTPVDDGAEQAS